MLGRYLNEVIPKSLGELRYVPDRVALEDLTDLDVDLGYSRWFGLALTQFAMHGALPSLRSLFVPSCLFKPQHFALVLRPLRNVGIQLTKRDVAEEHEEVRMLGFPGVESMLSRMKETDDKQAALELEWSNSSFGEETSAKS